MLATTLSTQAAARTLLSQKFLTSQLERFRGIKQLTFDPNLEQAARPSRTLEHTMPLS